MINGTFFSFDKKTNNVRVGYNPTLSCDSNYTNQLHNTMNLMNINTPSCSGTVTLTSSSETYDLPDAGQSYTVSIGLTDTLIDPANLCELVYSNPNSDPFSIDSGTGLPVVTISNN